MHIITSYMINYLERVENIYNVYIKKEYDKYTENLQLSYFTLYSIKNELKLSLQLKELINNLINNIQNLIINKPLNPSLEIIKDIKTNDDFYINGKINNKEIDNIVSKGIDDNILYVFYIFNAGYFTKNIIYNNIKFDRKNITYSEINYISNIIYKYCILRFNNKIMIHSLDEIDEECLYKLINDDTNLIYDNLASYDDKKVYTIDYMYMTRMNYDVSINAPLYNRRIDIYDDNDNI